MIRTGVLAVVSSLFLLALGASAARACDCVSSCQNGGGLCRSMANTEYRGCRLVCQATFPADPAARATCIDTCATARGAARTSCSADATVCAGVCDSAADQECADTTCRLVHRDCRLAVQAATRDCVLAAAGDGVAMQACVEPGNLMMNTGRVALDDCVNNAVTGLNICIAGC